MKTKILTFGEVIWDVYENESFIGGAGLNFAVHCRKCGAESFLFSAVGNDEWGERAINAIKGLDIYCNFIKCTDKETGKCMVSLDRNGMPEYNVLKGVAYDNITIEDKDIEAINDKNFDALYFGTLIQRNDVSRASLKRIVEECNFKNIVCDINLRKDCYDKDSISFCLENATVLKISEEEEPLLREMGFYDDKISSLEDVARVLAATYEKIKYIIFTLGEKGCFVYSCEDKVCHYRRSEKVKVASTVGAGDSFFAAWIAGYLSGKTVETATDMAVKLSGFVVSNTGAIPEYDLEEIIK